MQSGLAYCIFVCCIFFSGLPFTLKFIVEVYVYMQILNLNIPILIFIILICNWFGIISFNKHWFTTLFGVNNINVISDISYRELIIYFILLLLLVIISFLVFLLFNLNNLNNKKGWWPNGKAIDCKSIEKSALVRFQLTSTRN